MNTKALRSKILDLAIHGKLLSENEVAECRKGETATELLEKIRKEKEDKIAKGELKADKKSSYIFVGDDRRHYQKFQDGTVKCVEDEIPFEVPDSWAWCRFSQCSINRDFERKPISLKLRTTPEKKYDYYGATGVVDRINDYLFAEKLLLIGEDGANLLSRSKNNAFIATGKYWVNNHVHVIDCPRKEILDYLCFYINSIKLDDFITGSAQPKLTQNALSNLFIPLPPLTEQKAIVAKIEEIFSQIDILENSKTDLQTTIKHAKSKILDLAIHGKLVPQDPNDEPASKLLEKIRTNDKTTEHSRHYEKLENVPFEIPNGWAWCKLPELCCIPITDGTHQTPTYSDKENGIPFLSSKDVTSGKIDWAKIKYITKDLHMELSKRIRPQKNDILLAKNGTTGVAALVDVDDVFDIYVTLAVIRPNIEIINPKYLHEIINSTFCKKQFNAHLTGIGVPNLHLVDINKTIVPLPPLTEQKRIVEKIESLFSILDQITENLS